MPALGYKLLYRVGDRLVSKADPRQTAPAVVGSELGMTGRGVFLSPNRDYVLAYYSNGADAEYDDPRKEEVLLTLSFDPRDVTSGNLTDRESEVSVRRATIVAIEPSAALHTAFAKNPAAHPLTVSLVRRDAEEVRRAFVDFGFTKIARVKVVVGLGFDDLHAGGRHLAATRGDGKAMTLSPNLGALDPGTRLAITAHEFGHAADFLYPGRWLEDGSLEPCMKRWRARDKDAIERAADQIAEAVMGRTISYAGPKNLQTFAEDAVRPCADHAFCAALRPRPVGLR